MIMLPLKRPEIQFKDQMIRTAIRTKNPNPYPADSAISRRAAQVHAPLGKGDLDAVVAQRPQDEVVQLVSHLQGLASSRTNTRTSNSSALSPNFRNNTAGAGSFTTSGCASPPPTALVDPRGSRV